MQNECLEEYDAKTLLFSQGDWSPFLEKMVSDFECILVPACTELFQPDICKNANKLVFWYLRYDLYCKMLYHPLLAAITYNIFLRVSIKRILLEYEIPPFSNTRRKWLALAATNGEAVKERLISYSSSEQGRFNLFFLPFLLPVSTQTVFQRTWTVKLFQSFNGSLLLNSLKGL